MFPAEIWRSSPGFATTSIREALSRPFWRSSSSTIHTSTIASTPPLSTFVHPTTFCKVASRRWCGVILELAEGKFAIAAGDVHCTVDPLLGQGANIASHSAVILAEEIVKDAALDQRFCERVSWRRQERVLAASRWTNIMLKPPSDETMDLTLAMSYNQLLCDEFTNTQLSGATMGSPRIGWADSRLEGRSFEQGCRGGLMRSTYQ